MKNGINSKLIAPCGMNCGICMVYLRKNNPCPGCRMSDKDKPITRVRCKIKTCVKLKGKSKFCFHCENFPCDNLKHLDKRYRAKYNMSMIDNLKSIKELAIRKFLKNQDKSYACSCGGVICVHNGCCSSCGKKNKLI